MAKVDKDKPDSEIYTFESDSPIQVPVDDNGKYQTTGTARPFLRFAIGALAGIEMALQSLQDKGFDQFRKGDDVTFECIGSTPATQRGFSAMPQFTITVDR